jgi:hypothetical protein
MLKIVWIEQDLALKTLSKSLRILPKSQFKMHCFFPLLIVWAFSLYIPLHSSFTLGVCLSLAIVPNLFILFCPNLSQLKPKTKVTTNFLANMICNSSYTNMASKSSTLGKFSMLVKVFTKTWLNSLGESLVLTISPTLLECQNLFLINYLEPLWNFPSSGYLC